MSPLFQPCRLRALAVAVRHRGPDGHQPDLSRLADDFAVAPRELNLALDALVGRSPEAAAEALARRFGEPDARRPKRTLNPWSAARHLQPALPVGGAS